MDAVALARELIRCPSVTPQDAGALGVLERALADLGFRTERMAFSSPGADKVDNLFARFGTGAPHFCFAGHTDVVPVGDRASWTVDPFGADIIDGQVFGRGAADMKGAIAAFVAAAEQFLAPVAKDAGGGAGGNFGGSISLLITGDEEGVAIDGTRRMLDALVGRGEIPDACVVGEPTNSRQLGDAIKIGRRGSLSAKLTVRGVQGHTAYPHLADNAAERLMRMLNRMLAAPLDHGTDRFQPSTIAITSIDVGNPASNVIPAVAQAAFNIRFNDLHTGAGLESWLRRQCEAVGGTYELSVAVSGEAFLTEPGPFTQMIAAAVTRVTGQRPELNTAGGTSDARFIHRYCPVAEFGLVGRTMHKTDERAAIADIEALSAIYRAILEDYFGAARGPTR